MVVIVVTHSRVITDRLPKGPILVLIIFASEVTFLTNFSEDKKAWPIYMTIGNILLRTRNNVSKHISVHLKRLPVQLKRLSVATRDAQQRQVNNKIICDLIISIFALIVTLENSRLDVECSNRKL